MSLQLPPLSPPAAEAVPRTSVWVVIAAYNEEPRIATVLDELLTVVDNVVVVDDGSADHTVEVALGRPVWVLKHPVNLGQGAALQTGISFALTRGASYVVTFDADGQHDPQDVAQVLNKMTQQGADYALGSRFLGKAENIPASRRLLLRLAILFTSVLSGVSLSDAHNGFRAMSRRGAERIRLTFNRMEHASEFVEQIASSGLKYVEVPVTIRYSRTSLAKGQRTSAALGLGLRLLLEKLAR